MLSLLSTIDDKRRRLNAHGPLALDLARNLLEWFKIELTYSSNAIEGNTLSRAETALVVEKGLTVEGKTIREHLEAVNHAQAFEWMIERVGTTLQDIDERAILDLHQLILQKIDETHAGRYRNVPVRIAGSRVILPSPMKVTPLMTEFVSWLHDCDDHPVTIAADAHYKLVSIHPFVDGNGRTARLLMNLILMQAGYPPAIIHQEDRKQYLASIEKAQLGGSLADYQRLIYEAVSQSLDVYLAAVADIEQTRTLSKQALLKIGELAKLSNETVPTIRHWTTQGLIQVAEYTKSGYQLYDAKAAGVVQKIRQLQSAQRLTLAEIKEKVVVGCFIS